MKTTITRVENDIEKVYKEVLVKKDGESYLFLNKAPDLHALSDNPKTSKLKSVHTLANNYDLANDEITEIIEEITHKLKNKYHKELSNVDNLLATEQYDLWREFSDSMR
ncbi:MAG: hypothetical protein KAJ24_06285 [Candidatus Aenigmarchaeota archaeon]|nr:hypothetical protein [Candidatus Aenigmarchaeota archaeon]